MLNLKQNGWTTGWVTFWVDDIVISWRSTRRCCWVKRYNARYRWIRWRWLWIAIIVTAVSSDVCLLVGCHWVKTSTSHGFVACVPPRDPPSWRLLLFLLCSCQLPLPVDWQNYRQKATPSTNFIMNHSSMNCSSRTVAFFGSANKQSTLLVLLTFQWKRLEWAIYISKIHLPRKQRGYKKRQNLIDFGWLENWNFNFTTVRQVILRENFPGPKIYCLCCTVYCFYTIMHPWTLITFLDTIDGSKSLEITLLINLLDRCCSLKLEITIAALWIWLDHKLSNSGQ